MRNLNIVAEMTPERYQHLEITGGSLTADERDEGWHYCPDWDEMLIAPHFPEFDCCTCRSVKQALTERTAKSKGCHD